MKRFRIFYCVGCFPSVDPAEKKGGFCKGCLDIKAETEKEAVQLADERASELHPTRVKGKKLDDMIKTLNSSKREYFKVMGVEVLGQETPASCC